MRFIVLFCLLVQLGCTHDPKSMKLDISDLHDMQEPKIRFLGVGGWLMHWKGEGFLLAPSFSNPAGFGLLGVPPAFVRADNAKIDKHMPPAKNVTMLLVGHAHYDHLLDVPRVMDVHTPKANVYGSETVGHILRSPREDDPTRPQIDPKRIVQPTDDQITRYRDPSFRGTWFYSTGETVRDGDVLAQLPAGKIRAMPIESMHAPHIFGRNMLPGAYDDDLDELPTYVRAWKLGHVTLAWVIDLLGDDGKPVYRIHYQDSAAEPLWLPSGAGRLQGFRLGDTLRS